MPVKIKRQIPQSVEIDRWSVISIALLIVATSLLAGYFYGKTVSTNQLANNQAVPQIQDNTQPEQRPTQNFDAMPAVSEKDHIRGNKDAQVVLIEYSDFECPFCQRFHPTMQQVMKDYGNKVAWVYRHYPLPFHSKAQKSAEASECAAELGGNEAFWKMTDAIYQKMPGIELSQLPQVAQEIGLNKSKFESCLNSGKHAGKVSEDMNGGTSAGVSGTPGTILISKSGKKEFINGAQPYEQVKAIIDGALN